MKTYTINKQKRDNINMIEIGKIQKLELKRKTKVGAFLNLENGRSEFDVLLPKSQVSEDMTEGDKVEVFIYRDSEDRTIATVRKPKITLGELALLKVKEITGIGAFLDWGLEKDLFLPFREQVGNIYKGKEYLVGLYLDKSSRLCATMKIYDLLNSNSPYKENDKVNGTVYNINRDLGVFVAVDNKYHGLILNKELYGNYNVGDSLEVRIKKVRPDGKLELSLRDKAHNEIEKDANIIVDRLKENGGILKLNDNSPPEKIKGELNMSKTAFKKAVGRLLKEGAIKITDDGIRLLW